jgi:hypothetical protein
MNRPVIKSDLRTIEINIIVLTILLYLFRTTIPFLKFPFILFFFGLIIYSLFNYGIKIMPAFRDFFRIFYLSTALTVMLIASFLLSNKIYLLIFKECVNAIILSTLFFLMTLCITSKRDLDIFIRNLVRFIICFTPLISVRLLCNALDIFPGNNDFTSNKSIWISLMGSLSSEYNLNLIPVFLGVISIFYFLKEADTVLKKGLLNLILIIHSITILLSGSRRGLIALGALFIIFIFVQLSALFRKETTHNKIVSASFVFIFTVILLGSLSFWLVSRSSYHFRNNAIEHPGSRKNSYIKEKIAFAIFRYRSITNKDISYQAIYDSFWLYENTRKPEPDTVSGTGIHKTISPLKGRNVEIVPEGVKGLLPGRIHEAGKKVGTAFHDKGSDCRDSDSSCNQKILNRNLIYEYKKREGFTPDSFPSATGLLSTAIDQDPVRKWAAKFISEDTTYYGYKSNLTVDINSNRFIGDRMMRWQFGWQIFSKEFNWRQKLFGGGFNYLNWFGTCFINDKSFSDYPHNPFMSVLLYSGVSGLVIYFLFIFWVIYYYGRYYKVYQVLSLFFLITFFFSFFSGNSPFDPPVTGFFALLPFFIHYIHKKTEQA